jgi:hypothetical protein
MANVPKQFRRVAKEATLRAKNSAKGYSPKQKSAVNKMHNESVRRAERVDDLRARGQVEEADNVEYKASRNASIRLDAMLSPKLDKKLLRDSNPGPQSGFLRKAKKK